jgi:6-phosphogluconolactonase
MSDSGACELAVCGDADQLAEKAAARIALAAAESIRRRGRFTLVLAGGSTPRRTYGLLAAGEGENNIDWSRTFVTFGDERHVSHDDLRSNYRMARDLLLDKVPIAREQLLIIPTNQPTADECAAVFAGALTKLFALSGGTMPIFDLILLGLGDDGHTASLFPGAAALDVSDRIAVGTPPGTLPPPVDRITLTFPAINAAREVMFLVSGSAKAPALRDVLEGGATKEKCPAAGIRPVAGRVAWLVDQSAAGLLRMRQPS